MCSEEMDSWDIDAELSEIGACAEDDLTFIDNRLTNIHNSSEAAAKTQEAEDALTHAQRAMEKLSEAARHIGKIMASRRWV